MSVTELPAETENTLPDDRPMRIAGALYHPGPRRLETDGEATLLEPRLADLLMRLAGADGPVSREALLDDVWGDEGSDEALTQAISKLRRALGDTARPYRIIETAPKYGYRLRRRDTATLASAEEKRRHATGESLRPHALSVFADQIGKHRTFLSGAAVGAGSVIVLVAAWLVMNGPGQIEQEIVCPENATGAECLDIVNAVLGRE